MIPKVIVIILLTTDVVTSMKLLPVKECPNDKEWSDRAHIVCNNSEYRYHCMFDIHCTLVESCINPKTGSYSAVDYGVYLLDVSNETDLPVFYAAAPDFPLFLTLITNSSHYWKFQHFVHCEENTTDMFVLRRTGNQTKISREDSSENQTKISCEDSSEKFHVALAFAIIGWIGIPVVYMIVKLLVKLRNGDSNNPNRTREASLNDNLMNDTRT